MEFDKQKIKMVLLIEVVLVAFASVISFGSLEYMCDTSWQSCLGNPENALSSFFMLSIIRPLLLWPIMFMGLAAGDAFGTFWGTILTVIGEVISSFVVYWPTLLISRKYLHNWISANLPETLKLIRTQDYKIIFFMRLIPIFPFDLCSLLFGLFGFRARYLALGTLIGGLPEAFLFARLAGRPTHSYISNAFESLFILSVAVISPLVLYEFLNRKEGSSLWQRVLRVYRELVYEIQTNNDIAKNRVYHNRSTPVILLYGFFSSRRTLTVIERLLTARGIQVMSFNLGGLLGVFFTRGIPETAAFIDEKIRRQIERNGFDKVRIVCHSKGGMVALWWILMHGGDRYCDRLVTMGTPWRGSYLVYFALITPVGLFWRDLWQMRPGSEFIKKLHGMKLPDTLKLFCLYSHKDRVALHNNGAFKLEEKLPNVFPIPMHHLGHFEFLYRREVGDLIADLLLEADAEDKAKIEVTDQKIQNV